LTAWKVSVGIFSATFKISDKLGQRGCVKWLETENSKTRLVPVQDFRTQAVLLAADLPRIPSGVKISINRKRSC
jgi:hypothetical protein